MMSSCMMFLVFAGINVQYTETIKFCLTLIMIIEGIIFGAFSFKFYFNNENKEFPTIIDSTGNLINIFRHLPRWWLVYAIMLITSEIVFFKSQNTIGITDGNIEIVNGIYFVIDHGNIVRQLDAASAKMAIEGVNNYQIALDFIVHGVIFLFVVSFVRFNNNARMYKNMGFSRADQSLGPE